MSTQNVFGKVSCAVALALGMATGASASTDYPERDVSMVVAFAPGGITDTLTRLVASELGKAMNRTFIVENRAGAGGQVGTEYMLRQKPDGYTLLS
ncbi:MAG: hypothetical protein GX772_09600 [Alcaligenaceae bacterium]|nr:hypothetical protein [Alcaligenaceae bacterium]